MNKGKLLAELREVFPYIDARDITQSDIFADQISCMWEDAHILVISVEGGEYTDSILSRTESIVIADKYYLWYHIVVKEGPYIIDLWHPDIVVVEAVYWESVAKYNRVFRVYDETEGEDYEVGTATSA